MDLTSPNLKAINKNFKSLYDGGLAKTDPQWSKVAMHVPSTTSENVYGWLGAMSSIREWLGDRVVNRIKTHDFTIKNKKFENTIAVPRDAIEDDQLGVYAPLASEMGNEVGQFPDRKVFDLMTAAFATVCYDGQYLIDTDHPVLDADGVEQSVSNSGGGSGQPWFLIDDTRMIKPLIFQERKKFKFTALFNEDDPNVFWKDEFVYGTDGRMNVGVGLWQLIQGSKQDLTAENYGALRTAMQTLTGDGGRQLRLKPTLLVVGPSNEQAAKKILEAEEIEGSTNTLRNTAKLLVVPELG